MKICFISEFFSPEYGGQYSSVKSITDICKLNKIKHIVVHKQSKIYNNKAILERLINKCDIIYIFGGWTLFYIKISLLAQKLKKKIILHPMGFYEPWSLNQKKIKKNFALFLYQKFFLRRAHIVHCASQNEEFNLKKLDLKLKTVVLPFPIDKKYVKKKVSTNLKKRCIFFSRLHKKKGIDILIDAWMELRNKDWCLDIVGYGDQSYYKSKINFDKHNIRFLKPISSTYKKNKLFDRYDFLVLPTLNENFGIIILESLARGLPVLTTNETPWINIQNKNAGWIINYSKIELKIVLNQIYNTNNKEFLKKRNNAVKIAKNFTKEKLSNLYLKTFNKLLHSRPNSK